MRLIYVTASLPYGSGEAYIIEEIKELERLGHTVLVAPRSPSGPLLHAAWLAERTRREPLFSASVCRAALAATCSAPGEAMASLRGLIDRRQGWKTLKNLTVVPKALWLAGLARKWKADHIHCHWAGTTATMTMIASELSGIPWSLTAHRWDIVENNVLALKVDRAAFTRVISEGCLLLMLAQEGVEPSSRVRILHMGVRLPATRAWNPPARPVVLCPANLVEVKGHRYLLEAWAMARARGIRGELWLAGGGELAPVLESLASRLRIADSVRFLGPLSHERLLGLYAQNRISAVALASVDLGGGHREGIPVALVEAMAHGVPVIGCASGSIPELVRSAGLLAPERDPVALADAIELLLEDEKVSRKLSEAGRARVAAAFDVRSVAAELSRWFTGAPAAPAFHALEKAI